MAKKEVYKEKDFEDIEEAEFDDELFEGLDSVSE